jgi:hypothetical protein
VGYAEKAVLKGFMLKLTRTYHDSCTTSAITFQGRFCCYTLERPWRNNEKNVSCVPAGTYDIERYDSAKFPDCFSLVNFNLGVGLTESYHRNFILIHPANRVEELLGCIAPGKGLSGYMEQWQTVDSRKAIQDLKFIVYNNNIKQIEIK